MEYLALLGNVDDSILKINLNEDFKIEKMLSTSFIELCENELAVHDVWCKFDFQWGCTPPTSIYRPEYVYIIKKTLNDYPKQNEKDLNQQKDFSDKEESYKKKISNYLNHKLLKLRLLKEGSLRISIEFFFTKKEDFIETDSAIENLLYCEHRLYSLTPEEIKIANTFLDKDLNIKQKYINFAISNFEQSYNILHRELEFLLLMISLEALLNVGRNELRNRVARGCAVLLGKDQSSARELYRMTKKLYDKRSALVHTGDTEVINEHDVIELKKIVRQSIKKVIELGLSKDKLAQLLTESAFGSINEFITD
ncbi:MAG: hypothetical protein K8S18_05370 [Desulfobacula sp.]|nr:hypothetical protein [Desulfobacula sp.]